MSDFIDSPPPPGPSQALLDQLKQNAFPLYVSLGNGNAAWGAGFTKREILTAMAWHAMLSNTIWSAAAKEVAEELKQAPSDIIAMSAKQHSDALLAELEKSK